MIFPICAGDFLISQPNISVASGISLGGSFSIEGGLQVNVSQPMTNGSYFLAASFATPSANHAPAAMPASFSRSANDDIKIDLQQILANDFDPDADPLAIEVAPLSAAGVPLTVSEGWIYYRHQSSAPDSFTYTIADQYGASSQGRVEILIAGTDDQFTTRLQISVDGTGAHIQFVGIQTRAYVVQMTRTLGIPWIDLAPATNLGLGHFRFDDTAAGSSRYYRVVYRP